jgi:hypothetical protein
MRPIQVSLSISKEMHDYYQDLGLDDQIFREAAEMLGRKLLEDGILEQHLEPDINRPAFHYIVRLDMHDANWKPSEEQMGALMKTITWLVEAGNHTDSLILADLRSHLNKLM